MNGIINFYINTHPELSQDPQQMIDLFRANNKEIIDKLSNEAGYIAMIIPITNESCRVEKIDFNKPYPVYVPRTHHNLAKAEQREIEKERERREAAKAEEA